MAAQKQPIQIAARLLYLCALLAATSEPSDASIMTITCEDPKGHHIYYGENLFNELPGFHESTESVAQFGSNSTFLVESARPDRMLVIWGSGAPKEIPEVIREKWLPPTNTEEAQIILQTEDQITAIYTYSRRVEIYSLYPKLEYGVFTTHTENGILDEAMVWTYWGKCKFSK